MSPFCDKLKTKDRGKAEEVIFYEQPTGRMNNEDI